MRVSASESSRQDLKAKATRRRYFVLPNISERGASIQAKYCTRRFSEGMAGNSYSMIHWGPIIYKQAVVLGLNKTALSAIQKRIEFNSEKRKATHLEAMKALKAEKAVPEPTSENEVKVEA